MVIELDIKKMKSEIELNKIICKTAEIMPYSMQPTIKDVLTEVYTRGYTDGKQMTFHGYTIKDAFRKKLDSDIPNKNKLLDGIFNAYSLGFKAVTVL